VSDRDVLILLSGNLTENFLHDEAGRKCQLFPDCIPIPVEPDLSLQQLAEQFTSLCI
jgi:hypothetical protein